MYPIRYQDTAPISMATVKAWTLTSKNVSNPTNTFQDVQIEILVLQTDIHISCILPKRVIYGPHLYSLHWVYINLSFESEKIGAIIFLERWKRKYFFFLLLKYIPKQDLRSTASFDKKRFIQFSLPCLINFADFSSQFCHICLCHQIYLYNMNATINHLRC